MAITIKKSKLTLKAPVAPVVEEQQPRPEEQPVLSSSVQSGPAATPKRSSIFDIVALALAIISLLVFLLVITFQILEIQYYNSPPSAFPVGVISMPSSPPVPPPPVPQEAPAPDSAQPAENPQPAGQ